MAVRVTTPPTAEPVTLAEVREHLRLAAAADSAVGHDTQTVTLPAPGAYQLSCVGTGSVSIAAGTAVGTGWGSATAGAPVAVNVTAAGTVTLTVTEAVGPPAEAITGITLSPTDAPEDAFLSALVTSAREHLEAVTRRAWLTQTVTVTLDAFPPADRPVELPLPPCLALSSVSYVDGAGASQILTSADYQLDTASEPARLCPAYGELWPETRDVPNAVTVVYSAGYGAAAASVPRALRHALLLLVGELYLRREATADGAVAALPYAVEALVGPYRAFGF